MMILLCSGEKMPDIKWSELVEVKGKVRLEAFEKYIQELARSRNRGLMVRYSFLELLSSNSDYIVLDFPL